MVEKSDIIPGVNENMRSLLVEILIERKGLSCEQPYIILITMSHGPPLYAPWMVS